MASEFPSGLSILRRQAAPPATAETRAPHLQLLRSGTTARLRSVDEKGGPVAPNPAAGTGWERLLLRELAGQGADGGFGEAFRWEAEGETPDGIDLAERPDLVPLLVRCPRLMDETTAPVEVADGEAGEIRLQLEEDAANGRFQARLLWRDGGEQVTLSKPLMLGPEHVLDGGWIRACGHLGPHFAVLPLFAETVTAAQLAPFLSLFASSFPEAVIEGADFRMETGEPLEARPALVIEEVDQDRILHFALAEGVGELPVDFVRDYDIARVVKPDREQGRLLVRPVRYEKAAAARADLLKRLRQRERRAKDKDAFFLEEADGRFLLSAGMAEAFLTEELPVLARDFELFGTERLRSYRIVHAKPSLKVNLSHGIDFLDGEADLEIEGERISLVEALRQYRESNYIRLSDGRNAVVESGYMERLGRLFKKHKKGVRASFFDLPLLEEMMEERAAEASLPDTRAVFRGFNQLAKRKPATEGFRGELRPYQKAGVQWLDYLRETGLGGCLADDMGLGKTVQTIALLAGLCRRSEEPVLIVMPRSLLFNWSRELDTFLPGVPHRVHHGSGRDWEATKKDGRILLTTYGTLRADIETIADESFAAVILDEAQAIKNPQTKTARAVCALKAKLRLALSGTPVENHLGELYALFRFLNPAMFPSQTEFERQYLRPIQNQGDPEAARDLRRKVYPFLLRRLKGEVLKELPPKVEQVLYVEMGEEQKNYYAERRRFFQRVVREEMEAQGLAKSRFVILEALLELRQIATVPEARTEGAIVSAKRERLMEALRESLENGHKCLVFSNFVAGVEQVCEELLDAGIGHERMTGATGDREERVRRFQEDPQVRAMVMTLKTGGLGLNLTAADTVFILDPWWNTSAETQAVDRAHRIGQANTVFCYRLIARETIEEKILQLQEKKRQLVDQVVTSDSGALKALSESDIDHLFSA